MNTTGDQPSPQDPSYRPEAGGPDPAAFDGQPSGPGPDGSQPTPPYGSAAPAPGAPGQPQDPYAQHAQPQDPYAQHAQPQDPYAQPYGAAGTAQSTPRKPNIKSLVLGLLAIVVVGFLIFSRFGDSGFPEVGDCLVFEGTTNDLTWETVDCDDSQIFSYELGEVHDGEATCPLDAEQFTLSTERFGNSSVDKTGCLVENLHVDQCYAYTPGEANDFERVDCSDSDAQFVVAERHEETNAQCTRGELLWSYERPARTYCAEAVG